MDTEFSDLAHQVLNHMSDANGCVIVGRDGKALGAFPSSGVQLLEPMGMQLARLSGIKRAALEFSGSAWAFIGRPLYAAVVTGPAPTDPADFLGRLEQAVLAAENSKSTPAKAKVAVAEMVPARSSTSSRDFDLGGSDDPDDPLSLAQQFSDLFQEEFGDTPGTEAE